MARIVPYIVSLSQHLLTLEAQPARYRPDRCPCCGLGGRIWSHGVYYRKANRHREPGVVSLIPIPRFFCGGCRRTCSRLPECLPPRRWYPWLVQQILLCCPLTGGFLNKAAALIGVDRHTGRRWWNGLQDRTAVFALHLKERFADLGRQADFQDFWSGCLACLPLSGAMAILDQVGVLVP
ncbi:MAG: hypothetical protein KJ558_12965 [Gammaproteobacteria bacterium]|nr:hypothetical protein [Gammaproteobacteria bacterium]MBU1655710.1 hypothetical protein [Gammaproteobacteria bacterium]MBU1962072.1 hypothetical protein [Gammaproteobacteria bacterium]